MPVDDEADTVRSGGSVELATGDRGRGAAEQLSAMTGSPTTSAARFTLSSTCGVCDRHVSRMLLSSAARDLASSIALKRRLSYSGS